MLTPLRLRLARPRFRLGLAGLATLLLVGGLVLSLTLVNETHAASAITISTCDAAHLDAALAQAQASSGNTINFSCDGTITLDQTLTITTALTIDGAGHSVALDGGGTLQDIFVSRTGTLSLNALTIQGGHASLGGGIFNNLGTLSLTNSTLANNSASFDGAGIFNVGSGATLSLTNSTLANNTAGFSGGGLFNDEGTATLTNSTVANNSAAQGNGGGIINVGSGVTLSLTNSTLANNSAASGGGIANNGALTSSGSILAGNTATQSGSNCFNSGGTLTDGGYNLESGTDCGFSGSGSVQNTNPLLDTNGLQDNGGPTQTIALQTGSPAIDTLPAASCPKTDQRGVTRLDNGEPNCDLGAYEFVDPADADLALTTVPSDLTVNATSPAGATVTYTPPTATDESGDSPTATVRCTPASGSIFAIGTTTVTCTATDSDDTNSPVSATFTVAVKGAADQLSDLISLVNSFGLAPDFQASFDTQLQAVQADLAANNTTQACSDLRAFINHVTGQSGKNLTTTQVNQVLVAAQRIQAVLGC